MHTEFAQSEQTTFNLMAQAATNPKRTVELQLDEDDLRILAKQCRDDVVQVHVAVGYLTNYLVRGDFHNVLIYRNREDIEAFYTHDSGRRFVMGAVWNTDTRKFSFHS